MSEPDWQTERERLIEQAESYRDKWTTWNSGYYAATLAVNGILVAVAPLITTHRLISLMVCLPALAGGFAALNSMRVYIRLYDKLGFEKIPESQADEKAYNEKQISTLSDFINERHKRQFWDTLIRWCLVASACGIGMALYFI